MSWFVEISALSKPVERSFLHFHNHRHRRASGQRPTLLIPVSGALSIGTSPICELVLRDDDTDAWIALQHCCITRLPEGQVTVRNLSAHPITIQEQGLDGALIRIASKADAIICWRRRYKLTIAREWVFGLSLLGPSSESQSDIGANEDGTRTLFQRPDAGLSSSLLSPSKIGPKQVSDVAEQQKQQQQQQQQKLTQEQRLSERSLQSSDHGRIPPQHRVVLHKSSICEVILISTSSSSHVEKRCLSERHRGIFIREINTLTKLRHPNIVPLLSFRSTPLPSFTMPYLGPSLHTYQTASGLCTLSPAERSLVQSQTTSALAYLHAQQIVHRDIKPQNIAFTPGADPRAMILDFGLSYSIQRSATDKDQANRIGGTPCYLPPEAALGSAPAPAADLWALGIVFLWTEAVMPIPNQYWLLLEDSLQGYERHWAWIRNVDAWVKKLPRRSPIRALLKRDPATRRLIEKIPLAA